jgi:hypothetical protein
MTVPWFSSGTMFSPTIKFYAIPKLYTVWSLVTRLTQRALLVEQELLTLPEHLSSPPVFSGVHVTWSLVLYVCFVDRCLSFCTFSFGHCVVCSSSIYGFWLPLFYLQTLLVLTAEISCQILSICPPHKQLKSCYRLYTRTRFFLPIFWEQKGVQIFGHLCTNAGNRRLFM